MLKSISIICFLILTTVQSYSQNLVEVINETFTVNSQTSMNGYTRNVAEIQLPKGTSSYTYRISVSRRGGSYASSSLLSVLQSIPISQISIGANLAQYAISRSDGSQIDFFIFTTPQDKDAFYAKSDRWTSCQSFFNRVNTCAHVDKCINETVWFGFKNNNFSQGLDVQLEVVALVDEQNSNQLYSFEITNKTLKDMTFELSADGISWKQCSLRNDYIGRWKFIQPTVLFRMPTADTSPVSYKIHSTERYVLKWNESVQRWDLFNY